jgi:hypothetical protein
MYSACQCISGRRAVVDLGGVKSNVVFPRLRQPFKQRCHLPLGPFPGAKADHGGKHRPSERQVHPSLHELSECPSMLPKRARLYFRQLRSSRVLAFQRGDDQPLPVGLEIQVGILRYPEQVEDRPINDDPRTVSDCLQALRHASSMNNVHNVVQRSVRRIVFAYDRTRIPKLAALAANTFVQVACAVGQASIAR